MQRYLNVSGVSPVTMFECGMGDITICFNSGWKYLYTNRSAGSLNIQQMQELARNGRGLATYITQVVKDGYAEKWR